MRPQGEQGDWTAGERSDSTTSDRAAGRGARAIAAALWILALSALVLGAGAGAAGATTPSRPAAHTGAAADVSYATATLRGAVNPHRLTTYYYFQYGQTRAYGSQTPLAEAGAGATGVAVRAPIGGLAPLTIYHFRLVAVSSAGTTLGGDRAFKTTKVPLSLQMISSPNPVAFGGAVSIEGTLSGTGNANREVVLQGDAFPFSAGFLDVGNPELTTSTGSFSFVVLGLQMATEYRVVTTSKAAVVSPVVTESVAVLVSARHAPGRRRRRVRVFGTVTPAENGMRVGIMRFRHGHETLAGGAVLHADGPGRSAFSAVIRRRPGVYRVLAAISGAQTKAYSAPFFIR
jgi:hypothetical protein